MSLAQLSDSIPPMRRKVFGHVLEIKFRGDANSGMSILDVEVLNLDGESILSECCGFEIVCDPNEVIWARVYLLELKPMGPRLDKVRKYIVEAAVRFI